MAALADGSVRRLIDQKVFRPGGAGVGGARSMKRGALAGAMVQPGREQIAFGVGGQSVEAFVRSVGDIIDTDGRGPRLAAVSGAPDEQVSVGARAVGMRIQAGGLTGYRADDDGFPRYGNARTAVVGEQDVARLLDLDGRGKGASRVMRDGEIDGSARTEGKRDSRAASRQLGLARRSIRTHRAEIQGQHGGQYDRVHGSSFSMPCLTLPGCEFQ